MDGRASQEMVDGGKRDEGGFSYGAMGDEGVFYGGMANPHGMWYSKSSRDAGWQILAGCGMGWFFYVGI